MNGKRVVIGLLAAINVGLLVLLLSLAAPTPAAMAQSGRGGGGFLCATAKPAGRTFEVLYMIDLSDRKLHAFFPASPQSKQFTNAEPRDLNKDFGK